MSGLSRRKGAAWQAELAKRWRDAGIYICARSTQGEQSKGQPLPDVDGTAWWVEAKHRRAANPVQALRQAENERDAAGDPRRPIAVVRPHGCGAESAVVVMRLADWERLVGGGGST